MNKKISKPMLLDELAKPVPQLKTTTTLPANTLEAIKNIAKKYKTEQGLRVLFTGPSGTGKTLAAKVLATQLGIDLYRVDLAAVVNKYIGETEKNLHKILTRAEELDVVLLLDEGDSLLGSRTEVRNPRDRFVNMEINFLIKQLEVYTGIVILATNCKEDVEGETIERIHSVIEIPAVRK